MEIYKEMVVIPHSKKTQSTKSLFIGVQFRYKLGKDKVYSADLIDSFLKNFDTEMVTKMVE